jgi:hemoglobin/transferrin/lactoferrin receptor protein
MKILKTRFLLESVALGAIAFGQAAAEDAPLVNEKITVTATREAKAVDEVPATVSVLTQEKIEEELATDIKDLVRFEPGVSVRNAPSRFTAAGANTGRDGNAGFNIRGLDGNRVLIQVDGIRAPDAFAFGGQAVGRGDYADLDLLKSVEILRGPASALYGSDGVAGAVSFVTKDPEDFLISDRPYAARLRAAYASADESTATGAVLAGGLGDFSAMLASTVRDASEQENKGTNESLDIRRTAPNPQTFTTQSWLGKLVYAPNDVHRLRLTGETFDRKITTEVFSARAVLPISPGPTAATAVLDLDAIDTITRDRVSLDYSYKQDGWIDEALVSVFRQTSETVEYADEDRNTAADRLRINTFDNEMMGASFQATSRGRFAGADHSLTFGSDYSETRQEGIRDGTVPPFGEFFPTRAFPVTDYSLTGFFLQDEISLFDKKLQVIPALRYDAYDLTPKPDSSFPGTSAEQSDSRVSPKLGLVFWPLDYAGGFVSIAEGFKAPSPSQVNNGFTNIVAFYESIPNPDLKPETSRSAEAGFRFRRSDFAGFEWNGSITGFRADYSDFIEQVQVSGNFTPANPARFQFVNLSDVRIQGLEVKIEAVSESGWGLSLAGSEITGEQETGGIEAPLNSIDPAKIVAGLSYRDPGGRFGGQLIVTGSAQKSSFDIRQNTTGLACPGSPACLFSPDSFTLLDATAYWNITDNAALRVGVFNITDETYTWWSDVRGLTQASTVLDAYTQPGRNVSASLTLRF